MLWAGTGKLEHMTKPAADVVGLDQAVDMRIARQTLGPGVKVQGNVDPMVLFAPEEVSIEASKHTCVADKYA